MEPSGSLNKKVWTDFLVDLKSIGEIIISRKYENGLIRHKDIQEDLNSLLKDIIADLGEEDVLNEINYAIITAERNKNDVKIMKYLYREIKIFNLMVTNLKDGASVDDASVDDAMNAGKTIKDSIENFFELPRRLKKLLDILNELLSLIKG
jgi:hypothetical protein